MTDVELLVDAHAETGEGPLWDADRSVLWWLDIPGQQLHRFDPATGDDSAVALSQPVGAVAFRASGGMVAAARDGFASIDPETGAIEILAPVEGDNGATRMNDGKCDSAGRFYAGTMAFDATRGAGSFYRWDPDGSVTKLFGGVSISNGLDWTDDGRRLYYIDTFALGVDVLDVDPVTGDVSNRRRVVDIDPSLGYPDGMCLDAEGHLWVALYSGGAVRRFAPDGTPEEVIELPVTQITCCAFGGPDLEDLYITTAAGKLDKNQMAAEPHAGGLFRCRPGVRGRPQHAFAG